MNPMGQENVQRAWQRLKNPITQINVTAFVKAVRDPCESSARDRVNTTFCTNLPFAYSEILQML